MVAVSRHGQNRAFRISDYSLGRAAAQRVQKTLMPLRSHHDEIGAAFVRRMQNLPLDVPLFVGLAPPPHLAFGHNETKPVSLFAALFSPQPQRSDSIVAIE